MTPVGSSDAFISVADAAEKCEAEQVDPDRGDDPTYTLSIMAASN
ncbi:hypothetical protein [Pseudarthrobacter sulfonivorans]|nr:hypothetical protein [Pseudarthrobacter sulfonivorans]